MNKSIGCLILAAGKGTRMHSDQPKVLRELLGEPMLGCVYAALDPIFGKDLFSVIGHGAQHVERRFPERAAGFVHQAEQLGTGHALIAAWDRLKQSGIEHCLVVNGDTPLLDTCQANDFINKCLNIKADLAFMSLTLPDPGAFGRVARDAAGQVKAIVEAKDFDPAVHGAQSGEINDGIYFLRLSAIEPLLGQLGRENKSREYYITDLVGLAGRAGLLVTAENYGADANLLGINSPLELVAAEEILRERIVAKHLSCGVLLRNPLAARIGPRVEIAPGAEICAPCEILGQSKIASGALVEPYCFIKDAQIAEGCQVHPFSHLEKALLGPDCSVGPYARLRPGAELKQGAKVGNFVELKKAVLGVNAKASHLSYLGDAEIGDEVNVGAGTITCNYDGTHKHRTIIGRGSFIGSNTALVAPVTLGENVLVGAGSVITKNVGDNEMAIARARQSNLRRRGK